MKMHYNRIPVRRGTVALFIAMLITGILFITVMANFQTGKQYRYVMKKSFLEFQAQYMAQAALQHVELKIRYFPTELIDASDLSKGRNPFFDFTELGATEYGNLAPIRQGEYKQDPVDSNMYFHVASPFNMGPRFISEGTISTNNSKKWFELETLDAQDTAPTNFGAKESLWFPSGWPTLDGNKVKNSDLYLWKFFSDINTDAAIQPALT